MPGRVLLVLLLLPYAGWLVVGYEYHFLDGVNLAFHEAGHLFFGLLGRTLHFLGGTLGQLFFPVALTLHFASRKRFFDAWICVVWLGESLMYAAEYIADARRLVLPLVGGHIHDWNWLLGRWGMLEHCEGIAAGLHGLAALLATACVIGAWYSAAPDEAEALAIG